MLIDKYYDYLKEKGLNRVIVAPKSMIVKNSQDDEGWIEWKPAESNISRDEINALESKFNITLPSEYIDLIRKKQFMDIQIDGYTLYGVNELNTLSKLSVLLPEKVVTAGYFPIGNIGDADYIALDTNTKKVVRLSFEDYSVKEIVSNSFDKFLTLLYGKL